MPRGFQTPVYQCGHPNYVPKLKKTGAKQRQQFNRIVSVNMSLPSQTFNLSILLKTIELKTLCMSVPAYLFKCITNIVFAYK